MAPSERVLRQRILVGQLAERELAKREPLSRATASASGSASSSGGAGAADLARLVADPLRPRSDRACLNALDAIKAAALRRAAKMTGKVEEKNNEADEPSVKKGTGKNKGFTVEEETDDEDITAMLFDSDYDSATSRTMTDSSSDRRGWRVPQPKKRPRR